LIDAQSLVPAQRLFGRAGTGKGNDGS
jgi:hypothetical protein